MTQFILATYEDRFQSIFHYELYPESTNIPNLLDHLALSSFKGREIISMSPKYMLFEDGSKINLQFLKLTELQNIITI